MARLPQVDLSHTDRQLTPRGKRLEAKALRADAQRRLDLARLLEQAADREEQEDA